MHYNLFYGPESNYNLKCLILELLVRITIVIKYYNIIIIKIITTRILM
jgi:hypothetical protein